MPMMWVAPWARCARGCFVVPLRILVLGQLDRQAWKPEAIKWQQTVPTDELHSLAVPALPSTILPCRRGALEGVALAAWNFHILQRLQACVVDKVQHGPSFLSNKGPRHIVPLVAAAPPQVAKPTAHIIWNHVRAIPWILPQWKPHFTDIVPTVDDFWWQLTQAVTTAERSWVLESNGPALPCSTTAQTS